MTSLLLGEYLAGTLVVLMLSGGETSGISGSVGMAGMTTLAVAGT